MLIKHLPTIVHTAMTATAQGRYITPTEFFRFVHDGINGDRLTDSEEETFAKMRHEFEPGNHCITKACGCRATYHMPWTGPTSPVAVGDRNPSYFMTCEPKSREALTEDYTYWFSLGAGVAACNFAIAGRYGVSNPPHAAEQNAAFFFAGLPYDDNVVREHFVEKCRIADYFSEANCARYRGRNTLALYAALRVLDREEVPYNLLRRTKYANVLPFVSFGRIAFDGMLEALEDYKSYMTYRGV